jgi:hypothetical protein
MKFLAYWGLSREGASRYALSAAFLDRLITVQSLEPFGFFVNGPAVEI